MNQQHRLLALLLVSATLLAACAFPPSSIGEPPSRAKDRGRSDPGEASFPGLPLAFVENRGQADGRAVFNLHGSGLPVAFTEGGLALSLADNSATSGSRRWGLVQEFVDARPTRPTGARRLDGIVSYFTGSRDRWKAAIPSFGRIVYRDLWPGIDLAYVSDGGALKYEVRVSPGADPNDIRLRWRGVSDVRLEEDGSLSIVTPAGTISDKAPIAFQTIGGRRVHVAAGHRLESTTAGFRLGAYDRTAPLVIDPSLLVYAGYIGGAGDDLGFSVAVDKSGAAYVAGQTGSAADSFPEAVGPFVTKGTGTDAFVAKVRPDGTALEYAGYIGGDGDEGAFGIAVDSVGAAYITGPTTSEAASFPDTVGPVLTKGAGPDPDAFVAKVNPAGTGLAYAGYIGGTGIDEGFGIAIDEAGAAYVTGYTDSTTGFPVVGGPATTKGALEDAFVSKVLPSGTGFAYSGYIGGDGSDFGNSIAVDKSGAAYVTGDTDSDETTFPETGGPDLSFNGVADAFVAKVNTGGTGLVYAGYIGGDDVDVPLSIAVDQATAAYVTGFTDSEAATFPETVGPALTKGGGRDAFVAKVAPAGASLAYAGFVGGAGDDRGHAVAVDSLGAAYVTGRTDSDAATFPEKAGPFLAPGGGIDAFAAKVNVGGTALVYAGFLGGSGRDVAYGIAVDGSGAAYLSGETASLPAVTGPDLSHNLGVDAFVAKIAADCGGIPATIVGTDGDDVIAGTTGNDVIAAFGGNDTIDSGGGDDLVCAGEGVDSINGSDGDDELYGEGGNDTIVGGLGQDALSGGSGNDTLSGGAGNDTILGGAGNDVVFGHDGNDTLKGELGADRLNGGAGSDALTGADGADRLNGGGGSDRLTGGKGNDRLNGGDGNDRLSAGNGNDNLKGARGSDRLNGGKGRDTCNGGRARDRSTGCERKTNIP